MTRKYSVLWESHFKMKHKERFSRVAKFNKINGEIREAEQKMCTSFGRERGLGYMTVPEMLKTMH